MERGKRNSSSVSSAVLREDIVNLRDFIERLRIEEDQTVLEKLKLELTYLSACLQLCYYISDGSNAEMSCISYEDHVVPRLLKNIKSFVVSDHQSESSATMTEGQLFELLDALLVNLHYLPKVRAELILPSMTQYELLQNVFGNLRDFHGLKVNGCIERKTIEYVLPQFQLMAERVGHFCISLLAYALEDMKRTN
ncbi:putative vacuolar protein sorting-associated protein 8 -like protein isoform X1 [Capsicum annuum]|nr:putative vacuolar protein sorting-associated protein 8 -like protein isoform X1 [Capsicum annuum]KAF3653791.1 putative vacuolar protein sorting-associated protein 8 -like protein isoform X1 [Capsicum annuum]